MATTNATFGSPAQGTLANNATDTYQLTANAGGVVKIDFLHPAGAGSNGKAIDLTLTDQLGNVLITQTVYGNTSFVTTVAAAGAYYLKVADGNGNTSNDAGSYTVTPTLTTVAGVTYDGAINNTTATAIAMGAAITGSLNAGDTDMFKVHANSGGILTLNFQHPNGAGSNGTSTVVAVLDADGNVVTSQTLSGNATFVTTVAAAGDYYLKVVDNDRYSTHSGTYTLTPTLTTKVNTTYDGAANNTTNTAISSAMGAAITGSLNAGDIDMFKVHADSGGVLTLNFVHPNGAGNNGTSTVVAVLDADGNVVTSQTLSGNATFVTTVAAAGDYYLKVVDNDRYSTHSGTYTLTPTLTTKVNTTYDGAANNTTNTAISSAMGAAIIGSLNAGDIDMFKVHADSGGVLTLNFVHPNGAGNNGTSTVVAVLDADGNVVTSQTLYGNATFVTTVAAAGDYYLKVVDDDRYSAHSGTYTLTPTLSTSANTTYDGAANNTTATAITSPMGAAITGSLNAGDIDMFKVHADSGGVLTLNFQHPNGAGNNGTSTVVAVLDAAGNTVTSQTLSGNTTFVTTIAAAGDYYLKVVDDDRYSAHGGTYTLTPTLLNQPGVVYDGAANNSTTTALSAPLGTTIMGTLNGADSDYFKFSAGSGGILNLNFSHPDGIGSNGRAIGVTVLDSNGKTVLAKTEYGSDLLSTTLAGGGDYYIKISDAAQYSSAAKGVYKLFAGMSSNGGVNLNGTAASEKLASTTGNDFINGGLGQDTVTYQGNAGDYKINVSAVGAQVVDSLGRDGSDSLINVERLQFADKMVALDVDGVAGMAYRVYQAAFDRAPDSAGVGYWIAQMDKGLSLHDVANSFIQSQEFQDKHGAGMSNKDLATAFYTNVLHRAPDQAGLNYWVGLLDNHQVDAADVLASFSTSGENVAQLTGVLSHGISYTPYLF